MKLTDKKSNGLLMALLRSKIAWLTLIAIIAMAFLSKGLAFFGFLVIVGIVFLPIVAALCSTKKSLFIVGFAFLILIICIAGLMLVKNIPKLSYAFGSPYLISSTSDLNDCKEKNIHNVSLWLSGIDRAGYQWVTKQYTSDDGEVEYYYAIAQTKAGNLLVRYDKALPPTTANVTFYFTSFGFLDSEVYDDMSSEVSNAGVLIFAKGYVVDEINLEKATIALCVYIEILSIFVLIDGIKKYRNRSLYTNTIFKAKHDWFKQKEKPTTSSAQQTQRVSSVPEEPDSSPAVIMAEGTCEALINKGLEYFLMSDFSSTTYFSYGDYGSREKTYQKLNLMMLEILKYLELFLDVGLNIVYDDGEVVRSIDQAGQYSSTLQQKTITVKIKNVYGPNNIVAIICHECTHCFMEYHGLNWNDTDLNERRTDVMANLIGFSRIMAEGYQKVSTAKEEGNIRINTTHKIGYITAAECDEVRKYILFRRSEHQKQETKNDNLNNAKAELGKHIEVAKTLHQQLTFIYQFNNKDFKNVTTPEQLVKLQETLLEYESRNIDGELQKCETTLNAGTEIQQIKDTNELAMKLCTDMLSWISVFQSNN